MADTDNKEVAVKTLSAPKPPQSPDAQEAGQAPGAPEAEQVVEVPAPGHAATPADDEQMPAAPGSVQSSNAPVITPPPETPEPERPAALPETEAPGTPPENMQQPAAQALQVSAVPPTTEQTASDAEAAQSDEAPATEQTPVAPSAEVPKAEEPEKEKPETEEPAKELAARIKNMERQIRRTVTKARRVTQHGSERAKATAGPALSKTAAGLRKGSARGGLALGSFYRERLKPYLARLRKNLARRLTSQALTRDYRRLLLFAHRHGPDRAIEQHCFVSTSEHIPLSIVRVPHQLRRSGHDYRPTPRLVFEWAMEMLPDPVERHEFIDYGAGRGRVLLMASNHPFEKITGAEIAEELSSDCQLNIAQYPRSLMKCRDVSCEHLSALRLPIPEQETVFFFNNPFSQSMFERVIAQIVRSYKQDPRPLFVICIDIEADEMMEDTGVFVRIPPSIAQKLKIGMLSPYSISVYRTIYQASPEDDGDEADEESSDDAKDADKAD